MKEERKQKDTSYDDSKVPLFVGKLRDIRTQHISDCYSHPIAFLSLEDALAEMRKVKMDENIVIEEVRLSGFFDVKSGRVIEAKEKEINTNTWRRENNDEKTTQ